jgi:hypothetical protein
MTQARLICVSYAKPDAAYSGVYFLKALYTLFIVRAYQTSPHVVPRGGIFLGKWLSTFAGSSDVK